MAETADTSALERCTGASDSEPDPTTPAAPGAPVHVPAPAPGDVALALKTATAVENKGEVREDAVGVEDGAAGGGGGRGAASDHLEAKPCDQDAALFKAEARIAEAKGGVGGGGGSDQALDDGVTNITVTKESAHSGVEKRGSSTLESEDASDDDETTDSEDDDDEDQEDDDKDDEGEEEDDDKDNEPPDTASMLEQVVNKLKVMEVQQERINQGNEDSEGASPAVERSSDMYQGKASAVLPPEKSAEVTETEEERSLKAMDGSSDVDTEDGRQSKNKTEESADESDNPETRDSTSIEKSSFLKESFESLKKISQKSIDESGVDKKLLGNMRTWEMTETAHQKKGQETDLESSEGTEDVDAALNFKGESDTADTGDEFHAKKQHELTAEAPEFVPGVGNEVSELTAEGTVAQSMKPGDSDIDVFHEQPEQMKMQEEQPVEIVMEESVLEKLEAPEPEHLVLESSDQVRAFACEVARFLADLAVDIASERAFADADDMGLMDATDDEEMKRTEDAAEEKKAQAGEAQKPEKKEVASTNTSRASSAPITTPHRVGSSQPHRVKGRAPPPPTTVSQAAPSSAAVAASNPPESKSAPSSSGELRQARAVRVSVRAHAQAASSWPHSVPAPAADSVSSCKYQMRDYPADETDDTKEDGVKASKQMRDEVEEGGSECPWRDAVRAAVMGCREDELPPRSENAMGGMQPRHEYFTYVSTLPAVARTPRKEAWGVGFQKGAAEEAGVEGGDEEEEEGDEESSSADTSTLAPPTAQATALAKASAAATTRGRRRERRDTPRVADTEDEFEYATDEMPPIVTRRAITEPEDEEEDEDEDEDEEESVATTRQSGTPQPCMSGMPRAAAAAGGVEDETPLSSQPASAEREAGAKAAALAASGPAQRRPPRSRWERWMRRFLGGLGAGLASQDSTRGATGLPSSTVVDTSAETVAPAGMVGSPGGGGGGARPGIEPGAVSQTGSLPRGATSLGRLAATLRARTLPAAFHATQRGKGKRTKEEKQRAKEEKEREKQRRRAEKEGKDTGGGVSTGATAAGSSTTAGAAVSSTSADTQDKAAVEALGALATMKRRSAQLWRRTLGLRRGESGGVAAMAVAPTDEGANAGNRYLQGQALSGASAEAAMEEVSLGRGARQVDVVAAPMQDPDRGGSISMPAAPPPGAGGGSSGGMAGSGGGADDGLDATVAAMGQGEDEAMAQAEPGRRREI